jgi:hypothetical protein
MRLARCSWFGVLALWFVCVSSTAPAFAADSIERNPAFRPVNPHWQTLGTELYPWKYLYVDTLQIGGTNYTGTNIVGFSWTPISFASTVTLPAGSNAYVVDLGSGVWQLGIPRGNTGATGATGPQGPAGTNATTVGITTTQVLHLAAGGWVSNVFQNGLLVSVGTGTSGWHILGEEPPEVVVYLLAEAGGNLTTEWGDKLLIE